MRCQEALERVYWSHRSPDPEDLVRAGSPQALLRQRAEDTELKTAALRSFWQVTVSPQQVQAELDRMAAHSQSPARLRELFAALGNDPALVAECLARPALVDRLLRSRVRPRCAPARRGEERRGARAGRDGLTQRRAGALRRAQRDRVATRTRPAARFRHARDGAGRVRRPRARAGEGDGEGAGTDRARPPEPAAGR